MPTPTTEAPLTLEERIVANMQGAQLLGNAFETVFFHHGSWASEAIRPPESDEHCERVTYSWSVIDAISESEFTLVYDVLTEDPECLPLPFSRVTAVFSGSEQVDGRTVYEYAHFYDDGPDPSPGTRTVCSSDWAEPEPCGMTLLGFEMSTPPQG